MKTVKSTRIGKSVARIPKPGAAIRAPVASKPAAKQAFNLANKRFAGAFKKLAER